MPATSTKTNNVVNSNNGKAAAEDFVDVITREAGYRRCLILDGNVRDLFGDGKRHYLLLPEVLLSRLAAMDRDGQLCFTICGRWDRIDGLRFMNPMMQQAFQRALRQPSCAAAAPCSHPATNPPTEYDDGSSDTQPQADQRSPEATETNGVYRQPEEAFPAMRQVLSHNSERAAFILDWTEHLVGSSTHQDLAERQFLTVLAKATAEQPVGQTGPDALRGPTGLLIIITSDLASLPTSLYKDNPRTKVITVPRPDRPQRLAFFTHNQRDLRVSEPKAAPGQPTFQYSSCDAILNRMTDLCDGLTTVDMRNLLALSRQLPSKVPPGRLVNLYKFGQQRSPWEDLDGQKLMGVAEEIKKRVIGQDEAVEAVVTMLKRAHMGLGGLEHSSDRKKPKGKLFFVGPSGVGKTELAKATAEFLFGDESACIRFDMSEYSHEHDDQRLVGAPPSYVGFEQGGQLTNAVRQRPFCVLLFDEIEKAHGRVLDKFLQILEDGRLTDGRGETTYFSETVIIFTSNIGADQADPTSDCAAREAFFKDRVSDYFRNPPRADGTGGLGRPELLTRLGENNIVVFNHITDSGIRRKILRAKLVALEYNLRERFGLQFEVSDTCLDWLGNRSLSGCGGRDLINVIERDVINPLATFLFDRQHQLRAGRQLSVDVPAGKNEIQFEISEVIQS